MERVCTNWEDIFPYFFHCISVCSHCLEEDNQLIDLQTNLEWTLYQNLGLPGAGFFQGFFRVLCLMTDRNPAASFPGFWMNLFYKPIKSGALPRDWNTASSTLHVGNGKHPGCHLACSQANSKHALEHSEDKSTSKVLLKSTSKEGIRHNLCFYHRHFMSFLNHLFSRQRKCATVPLTGFQCSIDQLPDVKLLLRVERTRISKRS